ncbi:MAG TPA: 3-deoxy-7-phosphoheptulonate synthase [Candidatus Limnocylindria bacterium]|nr:3-deoxy-7-phosphoheptulonate synthase [Candidatus Limnocylindria bacterium]
MRGDASEHDIEQVLHRIESLGFRAHLSRGVERTVVGVIGDERQYEAEVFEELAGVERVVRILHPYKLASRDFHPADRVITLPNGARLGGREVLIMAGPCAVESEAQLRTTAELVASAGVRVLRGGAFKPRTSPYSFQGLGVEGLRLLRAVADEHGMAVITEVITPEDVPVVAEHADVLQIGARNMANYSLLRAAGSAGRAVLLKRGLGATVDELLQAAEYVLAHGNEDVAICERGIRTFETSTRFTLDINAVPVLKSLTHLPVVVDPSHAMGRRDLVPAVAKAALACGADGLLVEVHPDPASALSDGPQSLDPAGFRGMMRDLARVAAAVDRAIA